MNLGATEFGIIGILLMVVFGIKLGSKKSATPSTTPPHVETDPKANFQNTNIDYEKSTTNRN